MLALNLYEAGLSVSMVNPARIKGFSQCPALVRVRANSPQATSHRVFLERSREILTKAEPIKGIMTTF